MAASREASCCGCALSAACAPSFFAASQIAALNARPADREAKKKSLVGDNGEVRSVSAITTMSMHRIARYLVASCGLFWFAHGALNSTAESVPLEGVGNAFPESANMRDLTKALWLDQLVRETFPSVWRRATTSTSASAAVGAALDTPLDQVMPPAWQAAFAETMRAPGSSPTTSPPARPSFVDVFMRDDMASVRALAQESVVAAIGQVPRWYAALTSDNITTVGAAPTASAGGASAMLSFTASLGVCCFAINWMMRRHVQRTLAHVLIGMGAGGVLFAVLLFVFASGDVTAATHTRSSRGRWSDDDSFGGTIDAWMGNDEVGGRRRGGWKKSFCEGVDRSADDASDFDVDSVCDEDGDAFAIAPRRGRPQRTAQSRYG